jgi:hypothetical protein
MNRLLVDGISAKASTSALLGGRVVVRAEESIITRSDLDSQLLSPPISSCP